MKEHTSPPYLSSRLRRRRVSTDLNIFVATQNTAISARTSSYLRLSVIYRLDKNPRSGHTEKQPRLVDLHLRVNTLLRTLTEIIQEIMARTIEPQARHDAMGKHEPQERERSSMI